MSDKFKQFKNELIDLCEKVCEEETQRSLGVIEDGLSKNTPKEDI